MNTGGPAFPTKNYQSVVPVSTGYSEGISVRDYFAAKAMQAHITHEGSDDINEPMVARWAYEMADAMLSQREKS
jgi:hypothetical protein